MAPFANPALGQISVVQKSSKIAQGYLPLFAYISADIPYGIQLSVLEIPFVRVWLSIAIGVEAPNHK